MIKIILKDLPKLSLNQIYAGKHWTKRNKDKQNYQLIIQNQFKEVFSKDKVYSVKYDFYFKRNALDVSNTVYMLKMIEDVLFEDDTYKIIPKLEITSTKGKSDFVEITIIEL